MIQLKPIDMANFEAVIHLELNASDRKMVAPNIYSLAEAYADRVSKALAIYDDDQLVGFVMYDYNKEERKGYISRLMVADRFQGKGYGRQGLLLALEELQISPGIERIQISYHPDNIKARQLYLSLGFKETGDEVHGEKVAMMELADS